MGRRRSCSAGGRGVIPEGRHEKNAVELREGVVDIGHSAHQGEETTKRQLRVRLGVPGIDRAEEKRVSYCWPSQGSRGSRARDPLKPTEAPEEPWSRQYTDHWGPTKDRLQIQDQDGNETDGHLAGTKEAKKTGEGGGEEERAGAVIECY